MPKNPELNRFEEEGSDEQSSLKSSVSKFGAAAAFLGSMLAAGEAKGQPYDAPVTPTFADLTMDETSVSVVEDGNDTIVVYSSNKVGGMGMQDLLVVGSNDGGLTWNAPAPQFLSGPNTSSSENSPFLCYPPLCSTHTLFYTSNLGGTDVRQCDWNDATKTTSNCAKITTGVLNEDFVGEFPKHVDGNFLYYATSKNTDFDIYRVPMGTFTPSNAVSGINIGGFNDSSFSIFGNKAFSSNNAPGGLGLDDMYMYDWDGTNASNPINLNNIPGSAALNSAASQGNMQVAQVSGDLWYVDTKPDNKRKIMWAKNLGGMGGSGGAGGMGGQGGEGGAGGAGGMGAGGSAEGGSGGGTVEDCFAEISGDLTIENCDNAAGTVSITVDGPGVILAGEQTVDVYNKVSKTPCTYTIEPGKDGDKVITLAAGLCEDIISDAEDSETNYVDRHHGDVLGTEGSSVKNHYPEEINPEKADGKVKFYARTTVKSSHYLYENEGCDPKELTTCTAVNTNLGGTKPNEQPEGTTLYKNLDTEQRSDNPFNIGAVKVEPPVTNEPSCSCSTPGEGRGQTGTAVALVLAGAGIAMARRRKGVEVDQK